MDETNHRSDNPYTEIEGYAVYDVSGEEVGRVEETIYDAPTDVLKYIIVGKRTIPADRAEIDPDGQRVLVAYDKALIESAPEMERLTGEFDQALRKHYGEG